jgi:hypothetical protein
MTDHPGENPTGPTGEGSGQPEGSATPPPTPPPAGAEPPAEPGAPASTGRSQYDFDHAKSTLQGANRLDLGILAAGLVAFIASLLPFYTVSVSAGGVGASGSVSAWHGFFGWFGVLVALATSVAVALVLFGVVKLPMPLHQVAAGGFGLAVLCLLLALFVDPSGGCSGAGAFGVHCDIGRGFGYWLALLAALAGAGLAVVRMRETTGTATTS